MTQTQAVKLPIVDDLILDEIVRIGGIQSPLEACGILLVMPPHRSDWSSNTLHPQIIHLPNRASLTSSDPKLQLDPSKAFVISAADILTLLRPHEWDDPSVLGLCIWHTHPSGSPGPSIEDMRHKIDGCSHLVVSLPVGGSLPEAVLY